MNKDSNLFDSDFEAPTQPFYNSFNQNKNDSMTTMHSLFKKTSSITIASMKYVQYIYRLFISILIACSFYVCYTWLPAFIAFIISVVLLYKFGYYTVVVQKASNKIE